MTILVPVKRGNSRGEKKVLSGGIERFTDLIYENNKDISLCEIFIDDREAGNSSHIIEKEIISKKADMLLLNELNHFYVNVIKYNIPTIFIVHEGLTRSLSILRLSEVIKIAEKQNAHIYFVSRNQYNYLKNNIKRVSNYEMSVNSVKGFVAPAFCDNFSFYEKRDNNIITVGRNGPDKDPFYIHKKCSNIDYDSLVLTNVPTYKTPYNANYVKKNTHWSGKQQTVYSLPHNQILDRIARSKVYVSTCTMESWGITALEALGSGVPLLIVTDNTGVHSSEEIAADKSHYIKIKKNCSDLEFKEAVDYLSDFSTEKRREIYDMTNEKHSFENWKKNIQAMIELRKIDKNTNQNDLMKFLE